jgi:hypothetical protein
VTRRKTPIESRPARHTDDADAERSSREAAELLGFGDPSRLCPADRLRVDLVSALRSAVDNASATAMEGGSADVGRLVTAVEQLTRLLPKAATEAPSHRPDPRAALLELILQMRERGEIADRAAEPSLREENAVLRAENEMLRRAANAPAPVVEAAPAAAADNVVPLKPPAAAAPPAPPAPSYDYDASNEWKAFVNSDGSIRSTPRGGGKDWGPVG